jgi:hypothetical protein
MRILDRREERQSRPPSVHCGELGCSRATNDGKPYCSEHVSKNDYTSKLIKDIKRRAARAAREAKK